MRVASVSDEPEARVLSDRVRIELVSQLSRGAGLSEVGRQLAAGLEEDEPVASAVFAWWYRARVRREAAGKPRRVVQ